MGTVPHLFGGRLFQRLTVLTLKHFFVMLSWNICWCNFYPLPLVFSMWLVVKRQWDSCCPLCSHTLSTGILWLSSSRAFSFLWRKGKAFSLSIFFNFLNNWPIITLVQEANSEIGSSQSCHKGFELTAFLSLICPVCLLPVILEIHFCLGIYQLTQGCSQSFLWHFQISRKDIWKRKRKWWPA